MWLTRRGGMARGGGAGFILSPTGPHEPSASASYDSTCSHLCHSHSRRWAEALRVASESASVARTNVDDGWGGCDTQPPTPASTKQGVSPVRSAAVSERTKMGTRPAGAGARALEVRVYWHFALQALLAIAFFAQLSTAAASFFGFAAVGGLAAPMHEAAVAEQPWMASSTGWQSAFLPQAVSCFAQVLSTH